MSAPGQPRNWTQTWLSSGSVKRDVARCAACAGGVLALGLGACSTDPYKPPAELSERQICLEHYKTDPAMRSKCDVKPELRDGPAPDARPQDLPVKSGQISE
ncbi:MAG: hypothetical protein R3C52_10915 [Hyphomonadaceae bacterium]